MAVAVRVQDAKGEQVTTMKDDLIRRQDAIDALGEEPLVWDENDDYDVGVRNQWRYDIECIKEVPSAQLERKKGKWIRIGHFGRSYKCNQCGNSLDFDGVNVGRGDANFCPNCGADMRGE